MNLFKKCSKILNYPAKGSISLTVSVFSHIEMPYSEARPNFVLLLLLIGLIFKESCTICTASVKHKYMGPDPISEKRINLRPLGYNSVY